MQGLQDAIAQMPPYVLVELTPAQFLHEFVLNWQRLLMQQVGQYLRQRQQAVGQIRGETSNGTIQVVAGTGVAISPDRLQALQGGDSCWTRGVRTHLAGPCAGW